MSRWFRHYAGMMRDEKLVRAAMRSNQTVERVVWIWGAILESASEENDGGRYEIDSGEIAYFLRCDAADVDSVVGALQALGRVNEGVVVQWAERQFESDTSRERQKRYRDRKKSSLQGDGDVAQTSRDANVTLQESIDREQKETTPSGVVSAAPPENDLDALQAKLIDAVGEGNIQPHGALDLSAMLGLIAAGVDLETDILPTIRAKAQRLKRPAGSWAYFAEAIRDAHARRIEAGRGVSRPKTLDMSEKRWRSRLQLARDQCQWDTAQWGPMPGQAGCVVPQELLKPGDGQDWREWENAA